MKVRFVIFDEHLESNRWNTGNGRTEYQFHFAHLFSRLVFVVTISLSTVECRIQEYAVVRNVHQNTLHVVNVIIHRVHVNMSPTFDNPVVFFDITLGGSPKGRIEMELYADVVPRTAEV
jgi:hypothetical protein